MVDTSEEEEAASRSEQFLDCARAGDVGEMKRLLGLKNEGKDEALDVNYQDVETGATALHMAAANGHIESLEFLLRDCCPKPRYSVNKSGNTPLHWALQNGQWEAAKLILNSDIPGVDVLQQNAFGKSILTEAMNQQLPTAGDGEVEGPATPGTMEATAIEVLRLILEHASAEALEMGDGEC